MICLTALVAMRERIKQLLIRSVRQSLAYSMAHDQRRKRRLAKIGSKRGYSLEDRLTFRVLSSITFSTSVYQLTSELVVKCPMSTPSHIFMRKPKYFYIYAFRPFLKMPVPTFISFSSVYSYLCSKSCCRSVYVWMLAGKFSGGAKWQKLQRVTGMGVDLRVTMLDWKSISSRISSSQLLQPSMARSLYWVLSRMLLFFYSICSYRLGVARKSSLKLSIFLSVLLPMKMLICRQLAEEQKSQKGFILQPIWSWSFQKRMFLAFRHCFLYLVRCQTEDRYF